MLPCIWPHVEDDYVSSDLADHECKLLRWVGKRTPLKFAMNAAIACTSPTAATCSRSAVSAGQNASTLSASVPSVLPRRSSKTATRMPGCSRGLGGMLHAQGLPSGDGTPTDSPYGVFHEDHSADCRLYLPSEPSQTARRRCRAVLAARGGADLLGQAGEGGTARTVSVASCSGCRLHAVTVVKYYQPRAHKIKLPCFDDILPVSRHARSLMSAGFRLWVAFKIAVHRTLAAMSLGKLSPV